MSMEKSPNSTIPAIPHEVVCHQILSRLPVKTLVKFSSVCKLWRRFITSDQAFIKSHLHNQAPRNVFLYKSYDPRYGRAGLYTFTREEKLNRFWTKDDEAVLAKGWGNIGVGNIFVDCCDGVFCLLNCPLYDDRDLVIFLWNPALRQRILLRRTIMKKCFEINAVGFGFDDTSKDHKVVIAYTSVVKVTKKTKCLTWKVEVYSLRSDSWTTIYSLDSRAIPNRSCLNELTETYGVPGISDGLGNWDSTFSKCKGIIHEGCFYWCNGRWQERNGRFFYWCNGRWQEKNSGCPIDVYKVDLAGANGRERIVLPDHVSIRREYCLTIFKGCISLCGYGSCGRCACHLFTEFEVWSMMDSGWIKQLGVKPTNLHFRSFFATSSSRMLASVNGVSNGSATGPLLVVYDFENQTIDENISVPASVRAGLTRSAGNNPWPAYVADVADNYVESLVSIVPPTRKLPQHTNKSFLQKWFGCFAGRN